MTKIHMTSVFAYQPLCAWPIDESKQYIVQSWYSKADHDPNTWDRRDFAGRGWYRYTKRIPVSSIKTLEDIKFPETEIFMPQIEYDQQLIKKLRK